MTHLCCCTGTPTLVRSRKQSAVVRCKICGGMPLVDRTELPSGSMLHIGAELTSFINSDLTWKVSKGNRSSSRRARKYFSRNSNAIMEKVKKDPERVDMPVSESEKLGVSVLRCRFRERVENVPIKKRRFLYKSPSPPPQTPSPHPEDSDRFSKSQCHSGYSSIAKSWPASVNDPGYVDTKIEIDGKTAVRIKKEHVETEDFSGISILAAAACSNSYGDDNGHAEEGSGVEESFVREGHSKALLNSDLCTSSRDVSKEDPSSTETSTEGTGSSDSAIPVEEQLVTSLRTDSSHLIDLHHGNNGVEGHSVKVIASKDLSSNKGETLVENASFRDDHSHWDLNTIMEDWECPLNDIYADSQSNVDGISEKLQDGSCDNEEGCGRGIQPNNDKDISFGVTEISQKSTLQKLAVVPVTNTVGYFQENMLTSNSICDRKMDPAEGREFLHGQNEITQNTGSVDFVQVDNDGEKNASVECVTFTTAGNFGIISKDAEVISGAIDNKGISDPLINGPVDESTTDSVYISKIFCSTQSFNSEHGIEEHNGDKEHPQDPSEALVCTSSVSSDHDAHSNASDHTVKGTDKLGLDLQSGGTGCDSDVHVRLLGEKEELDVDYDSQYEDGEVRDSILHTWEEYDREDAEVEHVDYGSDCVPNLDSEGPHILMNNQEADSFSVGGVSSDNKITSKNTTSSMGPQLTGFSGSNDDELGDKVNNTAVSGLDNVNRGNEMVARVVDCKKTRDLPFSRIQMSSWDLLHGRGIDDSDKSIGLSNGSDRKEIIDDSLVRIGIKDIDTQRGFRRELGSNIGEQAPYLNSRKDRWSVQGSRYTNDEDSHRRFEMESGPMKSFSRGRGYSQHAHARGLGGRRWVDSSENYRGVKHSPSYRGTAIFRHPGSENGAYGGQATLRNHLCRRSGSPVDRDEAFVMHSIGPPRERLPERNLVHGRGWSVRNGPQVNGRGLRGRFHRPLPGDGDELSFNYLHPSTRRRGSVTPTDRRVHPRSRRSHSKSRSRSRTRSPSSGFRNRSKSPNFRSDVRMQRLRSPNQRPGFGEERVVGFSSVSKRRASPVRYFRWIDDTQDNVVQFRKRSNDQYSSGLRLMQGGRLSDLDGVDRGRFCYNDDDDRRKNDFRYGFMRSPMRYDGDGGGRRMQYDIEVDTEGARSSRYRGGMEFHGRGIPKDCNGRGVNGRIDNSSRISRKESRTFVYRQDVKSSIDSKSHGTQEADEDVTLRRAS